MIAFIAAQFVFRATLVNALPGLAPKTRFIVMGCLLAAVVEGFHMISKPVYASLLVGRTPHRPKRCAAMRSTSS